MTYASPGDLDNDGYLDSAKLSYNFVMQPIDSIEVPIWMLSLKLAGTSVVQVTNQVTPQNPNGGFFAQAMLDGTLGFTVQTMNRRRLGGLCGDSISRYGRDFQCAIFLDGRFKFEIGKSAKKHRWLSDFAR